MIATCVHNSDAGIDVGVYENEDAAYRYFANMIRRYWWVELREIAKRDELGSESKGHLGEPFPEEPYEDDRAVVRAYTTVFSVQEDDQYRTVEIDSHRIKKMEGIVKWT